MQFFVSRNGEVFGPFGEEEIVRKVTSGEFRGTDLAMIEGTQEWVPLGSIVVREETPAKQEGLRQILGSIGGLMREKPLVSGIVCLVAGCLLMVLSLWPAFIYGPVLVLGLLPVWFLVEQRKTAPAIILLIVLLALPGAAWWKLYMLKTYAPMSYAESVQDQPAETPEKAPAKAVATPTPVIAAAPAPAPEPVGAPKQTESATTAAVPPAAPAPAKVSTAQQPARRELTPGADVPITGSLQKTAGTAGKPAQSDPKSWPTSTKWPPPSGAFVRDPLSGELLSLDRHGNEVFPSYRNKNGVVSWIRFKDGENKERLPYVLDASSGSQLPVVFVIPPETSGPAVASSAGSPDPSADNAQMVRNSRDGLVFVEGRDKLGSAFVCNLKGQKLLVTNIHVMSGNKNPVFTLLDRSPIKVGPASAAIGEDIMAFGVTSGGTPLPVMEQVDVNASIGDEVLVLGNAEGGRVINIIEGKIVGVGPDLVEVDAAFQPGNSGSPIIHKKSGKVVGVATYVVIRDIKSSKGGGASSQEGDQHIRRFGYRLDSVASWQPVSWPVFNAEEEQVAKIHTLTNDFIALYKDIERDRKVTPGIHTNPAIKGTIDNFINDMQRSHQSSADLLRARKTLLSSLKNASQSDVKTVQPKITYDYFRRKIDDEKKIREEFSDYFEKLLNIQR